MKERAALLAELVTANRAYQSAVDLVDEAAQERMGVSRTDARCLDVLDRSGALAAGELASAAGLSPAAVTGSIDRLEQAGLVKRRRDTKDRRRVVVEPTARLRRLGEQLYGDVAREGYATLEGYTTEELRAVVRFLNDARELNEAHALRLRSRRD